MKVFNLFKRDIQEGVLKNIRILIIPVLFLLLCCGLTQILQTLCNDGYDGNVTFAEYFLYCFAGADPVQFTQEPSLPILWLSVIILNCFVTFDFMRRDISSLGQQVIVKVGSRKAWWLSKCAWLLCTTVICYLLSLLAVFVYSLFSGAVISLQCESELTEILVSSMYFLPNEGLQLSSWQVIKIVLLLPLVVMAALNMLQMVLSLIFKSVASFIIINTYILLSVYYMNPLVIGSYGMIKNSSIFVQGGFDVNIAFAECVFIIFISVIVGMFIFSRYDILQEKSDE